MDSDKVAQIAAFIAAVIAGVIAIFRGGKANPQPSPSAGDSRSAADLEIVRLRDQRLEDRDKQLADEIRAVRKDCEVIISSLRVSVVEWMKRIDEENEKTANHVRNELREFEMRLRDAEKSIAVLDAIARGDMKHG